MVGKEFATHLDILMQSFGSMNKDYKKRIKKNKKNGLSQKLQSLYVKIFGIPEIGFQLRSLYFEKIISLNVKENKIKRILDAGSGIGVYTFWLANKFGKAKVTGGDIDKKKLLVSQKMVNELHINNVKFVEMNIEKVAQRKRYNLIVSIDVLEHLSNYKEALDRFKGFLDKGNYLYIHVPQPNQRRIFNFFKNWHHKDHAR